MAEEPIRETTRPETSILIVEDSPTQAEHLQYLLERIAAFRGPRESLLSPPTIAA